MPTPNLFKKFSSKNNTPENSSATDGPPNDKEDVPQATIESPENVMSTYSNTVKEAWEAAHKELPHVHGAEKVLNKIGGSMTISPPAPSIVWG